MIRPPFRDALLGRGLVTLRVIWGCLAAAVVFYAGIGVWLTQTIKPALPPEVAAMITPVLYAVALATTLMAVWWRRRFLTPESLVAHAAPSSAPALRIDIAPERDEERLGLAVLARFQMQSIIVWALSEAVVLYGLVMSLGTGDPRHVIALGAASLVLLILYMPSRGQLESVLAAILRR